MPVDTFRSALDIKTGEPLKPYTTFKIGGPAKYFIKVRTQDELRAALAWQKVRQLDLFVLGGGSNILISDRGFDGLVIHMASEGLRVMSEDAAAVTLSIAAGEPWDEVVGHAVEHGWWGIENLSHIPGQAGAALVQNIGAYGQQISDVLRSAEVMSVEAAELKTLSAADCEFGYRKSIFNSTRKNRLVIVSLTLALAKHGQPNLTYPDVKAYFKARGNSRPSLSEIRQAVATIRDTKFPFPREEKGGNAGSFFKNLALSGAEYEALAARVQREFGAAAFERLVDIRNRFPGADRVKIPTAFLMDLCGLKGFEEGRAKVNETQPLVLLNAGGATAADVLRLAKQIRRTIYRRTGLAIPLEPELVGFGQAELTEFMLLY